MVTTGGTRVRVFDATTLGLDAEIPLDRPAITGDRRLPAIPTDVVFLDDTAAVVAGGQVIYVVDYAAGLVLNEYSPGTVPGSVPNDLDLDLLDDRVVVTTHSGEMIIMDARSGAPVESFLVGASATGAAGVDVAVDPAGRRVATATDDGVRLMAGDGSTLTSRAVAAPPWASMVQVSDDGRRLLLGAFDRPPEFHDLNTASGRPTTVDLDDLFLGTINTFGSPVVFQEADDQLTRLYELDPDTLEPTGRVLADVSAWGSSASPDGRWLAIGQNAPQPGTVLLVDRRNWTVVSEFGIDDSYERAVFSVAWHPDSRRFTAVFVSPGDGSSFAVEFDRQDSSVEWACVQPGGEPDGCRILAGWPAPLVG